MKLYDGMVPVLAFSGRPDVEGGVTLHFRADSKGWAFLVERAVNEGLPAKVLLDTLSRAAIIAYLHEGVN